jgi:alanyl-tRNA synthetase
MLRIVEIDGIDRSACGGTHVRHAGEIGAVLLRRHERVRKATRVEFVCGLRAIRRARRDFEALSRIAAQYTAAPDDVVDLVAAQDERARESQSLVRRLESELAAYQARERYEAIAPNAQGNRVAVDRVADGSPDQLKTLAMAFCALPRSVFIATGESPPAVLLAVSDDAGIDAGKALRASLQAVGGRGGGSPRLAQGSVPSVAVLDEVIRALAAPAAI